MSMERKLTAILSADVQGYSRLMGDDEEATVRTLTAYRETIATLIRRTEAGWWTRRAITCWRSLPAWLMRCGVPWRSNRSCNPGTRSFRKIAGWRFASGSTWAM